MIDQVLIDTLNLKSRDFAVKWKGLIRKSPQLKHYNLIEDEELIETNHVIYPLLARTLDRGLDRSLVGGFFVKLGKERLRTGFPVSEVIFGINLGQKVVIDFITIEFAPENPMRMYQSMGALSNVSEFFLLASFYVIKGFLEEAYTSMKVHDQVSEDLLRKYFKDEFFFKHG